MTPYFNEGYEKRHTNSDVVLVSMWPWTSWPWQWEKRRRLERGMVVTFRYFPFLSFQIIVLGFLENGLDWIADCMML